MSSKHYDVAIIGGSLAGRIAAALLAKQGSKVLFLRHEEAAAPTWFHSSLFLEKLLGTLGGRSCFIAQKPIQVLSAKARVTLNNDISIDKELCREFGRLGPAIAQWFEELRSQGDHVENVLWENGGLPWPTLTATARFKLLCMRRKVNWSELDTPIVKSLEQLPQAATAFVTDLLQGLSLKQITTLTRGQAALLWSQVMRPENLKEPDFSQLLSKRFDQFHGLKASLEDLEGINYDGSRWTGGQLKGGGHFTATHFLLGDTRWHNHFAPGKGSALPSPYCLTRTTTSSLTGQLSPLVASHIICGGERPLRLSIEQSNTQHYGLILSAGELQEAQLRKQLEPALPFARYQLADADGLRAPQAESSRAEKPRVWANLPLRIDTNLYCADNYALLSEMGAAGAALLGWTLAENLLIGRPHGKE